MLDPRFAWDAGARTCTPPCPDGRVQGRQVHPAETRTTGATPDNTRPLTWRLRAVGVQCMA
eukprot:7722026-Lingulodinium_polyedra.AAC.1